MQRAFTSLVTRRNFHGIDERPALRAGVLQGTGDLGLLTREMTQQLGFSPRFLASKWKTTEKGGSVEVVERELGSGRNCGERFEDKVWM